MSGTPRGPPAVLWDSRSRDAGGGSGGSGGVRSADIADSDAPPQLRHDSPAADGRRSRGRTHRAPGRGCRPPPQGISSGAHVHVTKHPEGRAPRSRRARRLTAGRGARPADRSALRPGGRTTPPHPPAARRLGTLAGPTEAPSFSATPAGGRAAKGPHSAVRPAAPRSEERRVGKRWGEG